jgi:diguanylate cyclase (GGDEF)-like protein
MNNNRTSDTINLTADIVMNIPTVGLFAVDTRLNIVLWNRFMEIHSQLSANEAIGKNISEIFPDTDINWLGRKIKGVVILKTVSYSSWRDKPFVFSLSNPRAITSNEEFMYQDCSFWPLKETSGTVTYVCISIHDVTEIACTQKLIEAVTEEALRNEELSNRDGLTGLYNRRYFDKQIINELSRADLYGWDMCLMMTDIDHFKTINDTYGHQAGDEVLRVVGLLIAQQLRAIDIPCRYGGEEFGLILPRVESTQAINIGQRIRQKVSDIPIHYMEHEIPVTISIGISAFKKNTSHEALIRSADNALYCAKNNGRNQVFMS